MSRQGALKSGNLSDIGTDVMKQLIVDYGSIHSQHPCYNNNIFRNLSDFDAIAGPFQECSVDHKKTSRQLSLTDRRGR